ncbi:MAG: type III-A CRISPR-associated protein Csm2 [Acidobacteria bacterium]|nr:type III-A CRISPR-associated protein Csm2 [Acidobacteriota bacterium]
MPGDYQGQNRRDDRQPRGSQSNFSQNPKRDWKAELATLQVGKDDKKRKLDEALVKEVIQQGGKLLVETAEVFGRHLNKKERKREDNLSTNQIRNVFGEVKRMEMGKFDPDKFVLLKPKLAYAAARANIDTARQFAEVMTWAVTEVDDDADKFARFVDFFEAILAYHKAAGGK